MDGRVLVRNPASGDGRASERAAAADRLLRHDASHVRRFELPSLTVESTRPCRFSLDGEPVEHRRLDVRVRPRAMAFGVAEGYDPTPIDG